MPEALALAPGLGLDGFARGAEQALAAMLKELQGGGADWLEIHFASLPRRLGREQPYQGLVSSDAGRADAARYRTCDVGAALMLRAALQGGAPPSMLQKLYVLGDAEERRMILRSLPFVDITPVTVALLEEAHRTNDEIIFCAGMLDSNLPARALDQDAFNRMVLKVAFSDLPCERVLDIFDRADTELSRILLEFRSEREAAGRTVWLPTLEVAARAPCPGLSARIAGDLWHGEDCRRLAAARAAAVLDDPALRVKVAERLEQELKDEVREQLAVASARAS